MPQQMRWWDGQAWTDDTYERTLPLDSGLGTPGAGASTTTDRGPARTSAEPGLRTAAAATDDGVPLAAWGRRALARILDMAIVNALALLVAFPVTADVAAILRKQLSESLQAAQAGAASTGGVGVLDPQLVKAVGTLSLVGLVVSLVYELGFLLWRQATPGKLLLGLRVRPWAVGARLTPTAIARRWLASEGASSVPNVGWVYYLIDVLWPLRDARRQALHDKFAGTCVVRPRR
jgi:uncharacterized RDD family membrane protein YckC